jgi:hypothetical protein
VNFAFGGPDLRTNPNVEFFGLDDVMLGNLNERVTPCLQTFWL